MGRRLGLERLEPRALLAGVATFVDAAGDGDRFRLALRGPGQVSIADVDQDGLAEIRLGNTSSASELRVSVLEVGDAGDGVLAVEDFQVGTGRLAAIHGFGVLDLAGPLTPLSGSVSRLALHAIQPGGSITVERDLKALVVESDVELGGLQTIEVGRDLGSFRVGGDLVVGAGSIRVGRDLRDLKVEGNLELFVPEEIEPPFPEPEGEAAALSEFSYAGQVEVGRDLGQAQIEGDLVAGQGNIAVARNARRLDVEGDLDTSEGGFVRIGGRLGTLDVDGDWIGGREEAFPPDASALEGDAFMGPQGIDLIAERVGTIAVAGQAQRTASMIEGRIDRLRIDGGLLESNVWAHEIASLAIGSGEEGAIVRSQIIADRRIGGGLISGDMIASQILASPVQIADFGDGPRYFRADLVVVFETRQVEVREGEDVFVRPVLVARFVPITIDAAPGSAAIGSARSRLILRGDLVDSVLAANWSVGENAEFDAPAAPRPLAQTTPSGDDAAAIGEIYFALGSRFSAGVTSTPRYATGLYAKRVDLRPASAEVVPLP